MFLLNFHEGVMKCKQTTIEDLTTLAGVSRQTVSRVLNNKDLVADETRAPVLEAIEALDYRTPVPAVWRLDAPTFSAYSPLTTIHYPFYEVGRAGARLLIELINGQSAPSDPVRLETRLVIRRSCGAQSGSVPVH